MATPSLSTAQEILTRYSLWSSLLPFRLRLFTHNAQKRVPYNQKLMIHKFLRDGHMTGDDWAIQVIGTY